MKVKDLIDALKEMDGEMPVGFVTYYKGCGWKAIEEVKALTHPSYPDEPWCIIDPKKMDGRE